MISLTCYVLNMTVVSCLQHEKLLGHIAVTALKAVIPPFMHAPTLVDHVMARRYRLGLTWVVPSGD